MLIRLADVFCFLPHRLVNLNLNNLKGAGFSGSSQWIPVMWLKENGPRNLLYLKGSRILLYLLLFPCFGFGTAGIGFSFFFSVLFGSSSFHVVPNLMTARDKCLSWIGRSSICWAGQSDGLLLNSFLCQGRKLDFVLIQSENGCMRLWLESMNIPFIIKLCKSTHWPCRLVGRVL